VSTSRPAEAAGQDSLKGAKGAPARSSVPSENPPSGGLVGRRTSSLLLVPRCSPLVRVRSPPSDPHQSPPSERPSPRGCCTDGRYFAEALSQPGPHWVAAGLPGGGDRQTAPGTPLIPPGGDCGGPHGQVPRPTDRESAGGIGPLLHPRPPGRRAASMGRVWPSPAQETRNQGTRVARRTQFWSEDPL
jgi:hypothetical protein